MKLSVEIKGDEKIQAQLRGLARTFASARGEVYISGARNVKLAMIHAHGVSVGGRTRLSDRKTLRAQGLPARNPWFMQEDAVAPMTNHLADGANRVMARTSLSEWKRALGRASGVARQSMQDNIAPASKMNSLYLGKHASVGTAIATGRPMKPLKPATIRRKGRARPALVDTRQMYDHVKDRVEDE